MKKIIGISSCLAGHSVRYDGEAEYQADLIQQLQQKYTVLTFCPEVAIGMAVPRPPIHIRKIGSDFHVVDKQTGLNDYTQALQDYAELIAKRYPNLRAYIFKQYSPSCGLGKAKLHDENGTFLDTFTDGVFAESLKRELPELLVMSEDELVEIV